MSQHARRMYELLEPICLVSFLAEDAFRHLTALGHRNVWDGYFASRAAPLGRVPAEVVHAAFFSFADGEVARHIPGAWDRVDPAASFNAWREGSLVTLRRILGDEIVASAGLARAADLTARAAESAPTGGRVMYAAWRSLPVPTAPLERLWHTAMTLREHRGDGHVAALLAARIGGTEAHVLSALDMGIHPAESFGRLHHLPRARLAAVMARLRERGLLSDEGRFTEAGRALKHTIELRTDELAEPPWEGLADAEFEELVDELEPISTRLSAAGSA